MPLPLLDYASREDRDRIGRLIDQLRRQLDASGDVADTVRSIVDDVARHGDEAVVRYMRQFTTPDFEADWIRVSREELAAAEKQLDPAFREAIGRSIENIRAYQRHILPTDPEPITIDGARLGLRFTPMHRVGLHVPGGQAAYPSTLIMLTVPCQEAGVEQPAVVSPPPTGGGGDISPLVLGVCSMMGVERVYRIGGAQAIAALVYGTEHVEPVDFIAGPGNAFTQQAKRQLFGPVGIDGFFGPSEIVVLADETANVEWVAADLIAQAEHDPGCCFLVSHERTVVEAVVAEVERQLGERGRKDAITRALTEWSAAIVTPDRAAALELVDALAAEHVTLAVEDPHATLAELRHGGAWFLGDTTPVASGDYYAGPSHCLPTGTTARYSSGLSVYTFLKRSSVEHYPEPPAAEAIDRIATLAESEGLDAHAHSARLRTEPQRHRDTET